MVKGRPYQPNSQGAVERVHRTIKNDLLRKYIEDIKGLNITDDLKLICNNYNRKIHNVTKYTPLEVFFSTDMNLFKKVIIIQSNIIIKEV